MTKQPSEYKALVQSWIKMHNGDTEAVACWMRDVLRLGGIGVCRAMVKEASE